MTPALEAVDLEVVHRFVEIGGDCLSAGDDVEEDVPLEQPRANARPAAGQPDGPTDPAEEPILSTLLVRSCRRLSLGELAAPAPAVVTLLTRTVGGPEDLDSRLRTHPRT